MVSAGALASRAGSRSDNPRPPASVLPEPGIRSAKRSALRVSEPREVAARGHWGSCDILAVTMHAVSVRLDSDVQRVLRMLEASGMSRSEAIRKSILFAAAALRRAEVAALEADEVDRREMQEVASLMESLRAER